MALILEVLDARAGTARTRLIVDALPLGVGRALDNDLILDDPYVDAHHARIARDAEGNVILEDLGSVNGLSLAGSGERLPRVPARPGTRLRLGRTTLRFRDTAEPVPPALPDGAGQPAVGRKWLATGRGQAAVIAAAVGMAALYAWLGSYERSGGTDALAGALAILVMGAMWAGAWAAVGRVVAHRFAFTAHLAVLSAALIAAMAFFTADAWVTFLFPENPLSVPIGTVFMLAWLSVLLVAHLALASNLPRRSRWRAGIGTGAIFGLLVLVFGFIGDDGFTDVPSFPGVLKPLPVAFLPTMTPEELVEDLDGLREELDELAGEMDEASGP